MKKLFVCLSLIISCSAFAESPVPVEPMLLQALLEQARTLKVEDSFSESKVTVSQVLAETMGYPSDGGEQKVTHTCDWTESSEWTCRLAVNYTNTYNDGSTEESSVIISYEAMYDEKSDSFKVKSARVDFAG